MKQAYDGMRSTGAIGASVATHGLADLAMYEGRWADAEKLLVDGIAVDEKAHNSVFQASKLVVLAEVYVAQNRAPQAARAAQEALALSKQDPIAVPAALVLLRANRRADAQTIASDFSKQFQRRSRAYGAIIEGEIARAAGRSGEAKDAFDRAQKLADLWLGRFLLGVHVCGGRPISVSSGGARGGRETSRGSRRNFSRRRAILPVSRAFAVLAGPSPRGDERGLRRRGELPEVPLVAPG